MKDFDLRKYLAEGKLLKEDTSLDGLKKAKCGTIIMVGTDKYVKDCTPDAGTNMGVAMGKEPKEYWWKKNKEDKLVHSIELAKLMEGKQLNENAPGYDTRKFGEALPTLESVQAAYEDKEFTPDLEKDDLQRKAIQQMMAKEKKKSGKFRAGVRSSVKEGVWNLPTEDEVIEFVAHVEDMKDKFYHIGSDDVFNGLDQAIIAAKDLAMNSTYVEDPSNPLGEPGSLNEEFKLEYIKYQQ